MTKYIKIVEGIEKGFFSGPYEKEFTFIYNNMDYNISIEQSLKRTITITAKHEVITEEIMSVYYRVKNFLFLCDGQFFKVEQVIDTGTSVTTSFLRNEPNCYESADFMVGSKNELVCFAEVMSAERLQKWCDIKDSLDISFNTLLYWLSSVGITVDIKCAFTVESFIPLAETVNQQEPSFKLPFVSKNDSKLQKYLSTIIEYYGKEVFAKEKNEDIEKLIKILAHSRNRIAHMKTNDTQCFLDGAESVAYIMKLSLLYRVVLLNLIGIPKENYIGKLQDRVHEIDKWNNVIDDFLSTLK